MANTSATGGPLTPAVPPGPVILEGTALQDFLQSWIVGLTGLPGKNVRPAWQPEPPNIPDAGTDWMGLRIIERKSDVYGAVFPDPDNPGYNVLRRHQIFTLFLTFYGPNAEMYADQLNDGLQITQNLELLSNNSMGLVEVIDARTVPELVKGTWLNRIDMPVRIKRQLVRNYGIENIASASGTIDNEHYVTPFSAQ